LVPGRPAAAQPPAETVLQKQGPAAVLTGARAGPEGLEVRLSEELRLAVTVEGRAPLEVEPPAKWTASPAWRARPAGPGTTAPLAGGRARWRQEVELEPLQKGKQPVQLGPLRYREAGGPWQPVAWKPIPVVVTTEVARPDVGDARDITSIEELPPDRTWLLWLAAVGVGPAVAVVVLAVWLLRRRPRRRPFPCRRSVPPCASWSASPP
jgi:hypothetical protein